ncbi:MAG: CPBP family glutamic-type intramembrane protease [Terracidiphilus sp.]|jgi:membrane protease YdiL (CAAX protease family)
MAGELALNSVKKNIAATHSRGRELAEFAVAYGLILLVLWTPRPWQKLFWWIAAATIAAIFSRSFEGLEAMGLRRANFLRSLWVVGVALLASAAAIAVAARLHTLRLPGSPMLLIKTYIGYALWAFAQQFLMQCFFFSRLRRIVANARVAAVIAAVIFAAAHLPNPILMPVTLLWGAAACLLFLRYRNLYPLAMAHAIVGITIAVTVPGTVDHNMRVGLGYLSYGHTHEAIHSAQP